MTRTAIIAAMPAELKPLTRGWQHSRPNDVDLWRWRFDGGEWLAACGGAGVEAGMHAFTEIEKTGPIDCAISTGWAGALRGDLISGQAFDVSVVIDARTGERLLTSCFALGEQALKGHGFTRAAEAQDRFSALAAEGAAIESKSVPQGLKPRDPEPAAYGTAKAVPLQNQQAAIEYQQAAIENQQGAIEGQRDAIEEQQAAIECRRDAIEYRQDASQNRHDVMLWLVTSPRVADEAEKKRLASTYSAALVDMEGAVVARLAQMRGIPFYCIKGISDGYSDQLPDFNRFISPDGQFLIARFVLFAVLRPWHWPALIRMGENSRKAARAIADSLLDLLDKDGQIRKRNGYPNHKR